MLTQIRQSTIFDILLEANLTPCGLPALQSRVGGGLLLFSAFWRVPGAKLKTAVSLRHRKAVLGDSKPGWKLNVSPRAFPHLGPKAKKRTTPVKTDE